MLDDDVQLVSCTNDASPHRGARLVGLNFLAEELRRQSYLREDLQIEEAVHTLWMLTSFGAFDALHAGRGLEAAEIAGVLLASAERTLVAATT